MGLRPGELLPTRGEARAEIFEYPEVSDNRVRLHSSLGLSLCGRVRADARPEPP